MSAPACSWGWFVKNADDGVFLRDRRNNKWPLAQVTILSGGWGFDDEGVVKLPRPAEYDSDGVEVVFGDRVVIWFPDGNTRTPMVQAGVRRIQATAAAFLSYNHNADNADPNVLAARVQPKDADGAPVGSVDLEVGYNESAAVRASVGAADGAGIRTFAAMDDSDGTIAAGTKGGATFRLAPGQVALVSEEGHLILLDADNGIQLAWKNGDDSADPMIVLKDKKAQILATLTQIVGSTELSDGASAVLSPLVVQGGALGFFDGLKLAIEDIVTGLAAVPYTATVATNFASGLASPPPGYVSNVGKSTG